MEILGNLYDIKAIFLKVLEISEFSEDLHACTLQVILLVSQGLQIRAGIFWI